MLVLLFSPEAIQIMRSEIFKPEIMGSHTFSSNIAAAQLRGYARDHAPFTYAAWNHPETIAIISKLAGVDLIPWSDYEIAHVNLSFRSEEQAKAELDADERKRVRTDEGIDASSSEDDTPVVGWHKDSYPFVCVLMLSDCTNMIGGETALLTANGEVVRVRGPKEGCAIILQGRHITHQALRALGATGQFTRYKVLTIEDSPHVYTFPLPISLLTCVGNVSSSLRTYPGRSLPGDTKNLPYHENLH